MRRIAIVFVLFAVTSAATGTDRFYLTDPSTGAKYGPFRFHDGEKLTVGKQELVVAKVMTHEEQVIERMKAIIIPELDFRNASIHDVVEFLTAASIDFDNPQEPRDERGVNTVMNLQTKDPVPVEDTDPFAAPIKQTSTDRMITFKAKYISLHEAFNVITRLADLQWKITGSCVLIEPKETKQDPTTGSSSQSVAEP